MTTNKQPSLDEILDPYFGSWKQKGDTFYFDTNANEIAANKIKAAIREALEQIIGEDDANQYSGDDVFHKMERNQLRAEQRARLTKFLGDNKEDSNE